MISHTKHIHNTVHVVHLNAAFDEIPNLLDRSLDSPGDLIDILRLHDSFQVVLQNFSEVVWSS